MALQLRGKMTFHHTDHGNTFACSAPNLDILITVGAGPKRSLVRMKVFQNVKIMFYFTVTVLVDRCVITVSIEIRA